MQRAISKKRKALSAQKGKNFFERVDGKGVHFSGEKVF